MHGDAHAVPAATDPSADRASKTIDAARPMSGSARSFGILIFPGAEELDVVGPWEMLTLWSRHADGPQTCLLVAQGDGPVRCAKGMEVLPHATFETCPRLDYLLVPGGQGTRTEVDNASLVGFIAAQAAGCAAVLSVCTGSFLLQAAGLLSGRRATTHWGSLDRLRAFGDVTVVEERFVQDGPVWTSAGVSAGIDLLLAFIACVASEQAAGTVQFAAEYYPSAARYGGFEADPRAPSYLRTAPAADTPRSPSSPARPAASDLRACIAGLDDSPLAAWASRPAHDVVADAAAIVERWLATLPAAEYRIADGIAIHASAEVEPGAVLKPPLVLGRGVRVAAGAYLRGGCWIGEGARIGPGVEVKSSFVFPGTTLAHFNFVGDSVVGNGVNVEAGAVVCNHRNERRTGEGAGHPVAKFGALVGDGSRIGANAVLSPGTLLAPNSIVGRLQLIEQQPSPPGSG